MYRKQSIVWQLKTPTSRPNLLFPGTNLSVVLHEMQSADHAELL